MILKRLLQAFSISTLLLITGLAMPLVAQAADPADTACSGLSQATTGVICNDEAAATGGVSNIILRVISILSFVVGGVCVLMVIIGGFRYVISGGDTNGVQGAKNTILYAVVGLVVVLFARVILAFVYSQATK